MNHDENPNNSALTSELRGALSELTTPERPPLAAITSRGRAHQQRRLAGFAGLGVTVAAVGTALALGLTGVFGAAPARSTGTIHPAAPARSTGTSAGTIRTPAFILTSNVNGTDTLTLTMSQMLNPVTLQQALTQHGIPALVQTGTSCTSSPAPPDPVSIGVLSVQPPAGSPQAPVPASSGPAPSELNQIAARTVTVINPAAIPSGTELFFGYSTSAHALFTDLIYTSSYTCSNGL
jgi:hypothetical protein